MAVLARRQRAANRVDRDHHPHYSPPSRARYRARPRALDPAPAPRGHIGWVVAGSLATGLVAALLLAAAPFIPAEESAITGAVLVGFALGWAMLAVLSVRFTDQPQRWAAVPAVFMGLGGLLLLGFGSAVQRGAQLGVAARRAGVGGLDGRPRPPTAA